MEAKTFLTTTLSSEGYYCVFAARLSDARKIQKFYTSIDDVVAASENFEAEGFDVYYGLATFETDDSRKVENVKHLKSFFLDLDCGADKSFPSQESAIKSLRTFCSKSELPKPIMINSGRGLHVYWLLSEPVCYTDWYPVAHRLKSLCATHGLAADPAVTSDAARVLRVPFTSNFKCDPPAEVGFFGASPKFLTYDFDYFAELIGSDPIPVPAPVANVPISATMQALMGNQQSVFKEILIKSKGESGGCPQLVHIIQNRATMSEPLWRAGLSIAKFCSDHEKAIRYISEGHPGYSPDDTQYKVDLIKGPYTCIKFDEYRPDVCPHCTNWGRVKSPIALGRQLRVAEVGEDGTYVEAPALAIPNKPTQVYAIPKYPPPYVRGVNGGVYLRTRNAEGEPEEKRIYHNDLYVVKRIRDPEVGESIVMRLHLPKDGVQEFTLPMSAVTSKEEFRKALSSQGVAVMQMGELMAYTTHWVNELQTMSTADKAYRQFGWADDSMSAFILGNQKITATSIEFNPPSTATVSLFPYFDAKGTFEEWRKNLELWNDDRFLLQQFAFGMGFGSPLMEFMNTNCGTVAFINKESGVGKTALMYAAVGIWGYPKKLVIDKDDTVNFKMNRAEVMHSLVTGLDEITNLNPRQMSELVYQGTSGRQRGRMTSSANVERYQGREWSLLMMYTANTSVIETISRAKAMPKAEAQRILECHVPRIFDKVADKEITDAFEYNLLNHYGHAGVPYVQYIMRNLDACKALVLDVQKRVDAAAQLTNENRFWSATISATIAGLLIAKKAGLHDFNVQKVFKWATNDLVSQNKRVLYDMEGSVFDVLDDFFTENISYILQIKSTLDNRGTNSNGLDDHLIPEQVARGRLVARYETDTKLFYVKPKPLREWCGELQINYASLVNEIMLKCNGRRGKVRLTKGTKLHLPPSDVIVMTFDVPETEESVEHL